MVGRQESGPMSIWRCNCSTDKSRMDDETAPGSKALLDEDTDVAIETATTVIIKKAHRK